MAILNILKYPSAILLRKTRPVKGVDKGLERLIRDMAETMYAAPGVGLSANQIGKDLRLCIIDVTPFEKEKNLIVLLNPKIISLEGKIIREEGCLSIPGFKADVERGEKVTVRALDLKGRPFSIEANDLLARALQHEIDHLDGILFPDRLSRLKRNLLLEKIKKALAEQASS